MPYKSPYFFVTTEPNRMGVFAELQIISYNSIILKHIQINSQFRKILMLRVRLSFLFFFFILGANLYCHVVSAKNSESMSITTWFLPHDTVRVKATI